MPQVTSLGAGRMGRSIGGQLALSGVDVVLYNHTEHGRARAMDILKAELRDLVNEKCLTIAHESAALNRVRVGASMEDAIKDTDLVIEAIYEDLDAKKELFAELNALDCLPEKVILATNSIDFTIEQILPKELQRRRCVGIRFLFPVYFCPEVAICSAQPDQVNMDLMSTLLTFGFEPFIEGPLPGAQRVKLTNATVLDYYQKQKQKIAYTKAKTNDLAAVQSNTDDWAECTICMSEKANSILIPCGHHCCCSSCAEELRKRSHPCPICRANIEQYRDRV